MFQPFLRFYKDVAVDVDVPEQDTVSTLLEILLETADLDICKAANLSVSTLLEILPKVSRLQDSKWPSLFQPFLRFYQATTARMLGDVSGVYVSTLLEILRDPFAEGAVGLKLRFTFISHGVG